MLTLKASCCNTRTDFSQRFGQLLWFVSLMITNLYQNSWLLEAHHFTKVFLGFLWSFLPFSSFNHKLSADRGYTASINSREPYMLEACHAIFPNSKPMTFVLNTIQIVIFISTSSEQNLMPFSCKEWAWIISWNSEFFANAADTIKYDEYLKIIILLRIDRREKMVASLPVLFGTLRFADKATRLS